MSLFSTPEWERNVIGDARSKDLFNLGTINKKKFKRQLKKRKLKEKMIQNEDKHSQDRKWDKKNNAIGKRNLIKQECLPLVQTETQNKQKIEIEQKKKVQIKIQNENKHSEDQKCDKKKNTVRKRKLIKQESLPLIQTETQDEQKIEIKQEKKVQIRGISRSTFNKADGIHVNESKNRSGQKQTASKNKFNKAQNSMKDNSKINKSKNKFPNLLQANSEQVIVTRNKLENLTLRQRMMERLKASRFRFLNESMYTSTGNVAEQYFKKDPQSFRAYHDGFKQQVSRWPLNPLDIIIKSIKKLPQSYVIADFGCGDARLAQSIKCKAHSFDLIAVNEHITPCNMANTLLENETIDVAVFCLSLMGTNLKDYIIEANRVLKMGGVLKIVEVASRFGDDVEAFVRNLQHFGFSKPRKDLSHDLFYFMDFKKSANCKQKQKLPDISLLPCLYKKR